MGSANLQDSGVLAGGPFCISFPICKQKEMVFSHLTRWSRFGGSLSGHHLTCGKSSTRDNGLI